VKFRLWREKLRAMVNQPFISKIESQIANYRRDEYDKELSIRVVTAVSRGDAICGWTTLIDDVD